MYNYQWSHYWGFSGKWVGNTYQSIHQGKDTLNPKQTSYKGQWANACLNRSKTIGLFEHTNCYMFLILIRIPNCPILLSGTLLPTPKLRTGIKVFKSSQMTQEVAVDYTCTDSTRQTLISRTVYSSCSLSRRHTLTMIRCGCLELETGYHRSPRTPLPQWTCKLYNSDVENETHFLTLYPDLNKPSPALFKEMQQNYPTFMSLPSIRKCLSLQISCYTWFMPAWHQGQSSQMQDRVH